MKYVIQENQIISLIESEKSSYPYITMEKSIMLFQKLIDDFVDENPELFDGLISIKVLMVEKDLNGRIWVDAGIKSKKLNPLSYTYNIESYLKDKTGLRIVLMADNDMVTESSSRNKEKKQIDHLKKLFFKYWDKFGAQLSGELLHMFNLNSNYYDVAAKILREYLGGDEKALKMAKSILSEIPKVVTNCGSYEFGFVLNRIDFDPEEGYMEIKVLVDGNGTFTHMETGKEYTLHSLKDEDPTWAWEIPDEMASCISELIYEKNLYNRTGIDYSVFVIGTF